MRPEPTRTRARLALATAPLLFALMFCACSARDAFVWADDLPVPPPPTTRATVIGPGDLLSVRVWNQEGMSAKSRVRIDGRISLPFLNDVEAAGRTPGALAAELTVKLKDFIVNPAVTVSLEEAQPFSVSVLGEVTKSGVYPVEAASGVLHALAAAGGLTPYADRGRIFVVRSGPPVQRIRFTWDSLTRPDGRASSFRLHSGDVVVVE